MTLYFCGIIMATLAAVALLFFFTVGRPLAREVHAMLRSHTTYLASLVQGMETHPPDPHLLVRAFDRFNEHYGFDIALFDGDRRLIASSSSLAGQSIEITAPMINSMNRQGRYVQSSHFGRPLIYMSPVESDSHSAGYLYITRRFPENRTLVLFLGGLFLIGVLLTLAVYPLSKGITLPLTRLTQDLEKIASGQFDEVPVTSRRDEIGELIRGYRAMSQSVNQMMLSKKQLLADISHELCSPLARIRVGTELIKERAGEGKVKHYLENIENDITTMDHLIANLAAFSQMNLPGFSLARQNISPEDLVQVIRDLYLPLAETRQIHLILQNTGLLHPFHGDFERLKQVFSNLMDNALRYTAPGGVIGLGAEAQGRKICFFVEDQGPGVPESDREKIFEPLYRVDFSRNRALGGAGLGLAISRKIVELHGGELRYSRTNDQTRFTFCFEQVADNEIKY